MLFLLLSSKYFYLISIWIFYKVVMWCFTWKTFKWGYFIAHSSMFFVVCFEVRCSNCNMAKAIT